MTPLSRFAFSAFALAVGFAFAGCSDDNSTSGGPPDTTPPSVTSVTAVDIVHVDITFSENLGRTSAENEENYLIVETVPPPAPVSGGAWPETPGDTLHLFTASLNADLRTVSLTTDAMGAVPYEVNVTGVADASGNEIVSTVVKPFSGSTSPDVTPPQIVYRSPAPNATGIGVGQPIVVQFSEPVEFNSVVDSLAWVSQGGEGVPHEVVLTGDPLRFTFFPSDPLDYATYYDVTFSCVEDFAANIMPVTTWSYKTTSVVDNTPPTLVSSVPADRATNVDVNTNLSFTFSEAINQYELLIQLTPQAGYGTVTWSNGGKTLTFDPELPLGADQQYNIAILPGGVRDLAGNGIVQPVTIRFTTGSALESGSFAGTIAGDPGTPSADPTGAIVAAADRDPFVGEFLILGSAVVAGNNTYDIRYLPDDVYYPICVKDSNGDHEIDPSTGDAIGLYGADPRQGDFSPDSVAISGGNRVLNVNFPLYDTSAITGTVEYTGFYSGGNYALGIGVFDTLSFSPASSPAYGTLSSWPDGRDWRFNALDDGLADGTYYVGAFLDINGNGNFEYGSEPAGLYGGLASPTPITIANGSDAIGIVITMQDVATAFEKRAVSIGWPAPLHRAPWLERLSVAVREQAQAATSKSHPASRVSWLGGGGGR